jgi:hypothetical protein
MKARNYRFGSLDIRGKTFASDMIVTPTRAIDR